MMLTGRADSCYSATFSATNSTRIGVGSNPGLRVEKLASNGLSHSTTLNKNKSKKPGHYTGSFIMFSVITSIYNKKTKGRTLMELFTTTGKLKEFFF